ncbi:MAG: nitroreductase family protein [Planctomycetota bacterium]
MVDSNARKPEASVDPMFPDRWSPRGFSSEPLSDETISSLFEAVRWAPSCYNEQPWLLLYGRTDADRERLLEALTEHNQAWAKKAPLLIYLAVRREFSRNGKPNRHAAFDGGAAWMSLAFQARKLGLYAHAMAGFDATRARRILGVPEDGWRIVAAIAVGKKGDPSLLPDEIRAMEKPNSRKPLSKVGAEGRFPDERAFAG